MLDIVPIGRPIPVGFETGTLFAPGIEKTGLCLGETLISGVFIPPPGNVPGRFGVLILSGAMFAGKNLVVAPGRFKLVLPGKILVAPGKSPGLAELLAPGNFRLRVETPPPNCP